MWGAALGGAAGGLLSGALQWGQSAQSASAARKWQKKLMLEGPSWQVRGLNAAGINPIYAFGRGGGVGSGGPVPQAQQISAPNFTRSISEAITARKAARVQDYQVKAAEAEMFTARALASRTEYEAIGQIIRNQLSEAQLPGALTEAEIDRSEWGRTMRRLNRVQGPASSARALSGAVQNFIRGGRSAGALFR